MSEKFKIEDGVPIRHAYSGRAMKYPFKELQVGQSFYVPLDGHKSVYTLQCSLLTCARQAGIKVTTATDDNGVRVWRIE